MRTVAIVAVLIAALLVSAASVVYLNSVREQSAALATFVYVSPTPSATVTPTPSATPRCGGSRAGCPTVTP